MSESELDAIQGREPCREGGLARTQLLPVVPGRKQRVGGITKQSGVDTKELYQLFPGGPAKVAAKIAGLKKPTGCI